MNKIKFYKETAAGTYCAYAYIGRQRVSLGTYFHEYKGALIAQLGQQYKEFYVNNKQYKHLILQKYALLDV